MEEVGFTVAALVGIFSGEMAEELDVDAITQKLRDVGKDRREEVHQVTAAPVESSQPPATQPNDVLSSDHQEPIAEKAIPATVSESISSPPPKSTSSLDAISEPPPPPIAAGAKLTGVDASSATSAAEPEAAPIAAQPDHPGVASGVNGITGHSPQSTDQETSKATTGHSEVNGASAAGPQLVDGQAETPANLEAEHQAAKVKQEAQAQAQRLQAEKEEAQRLQAEQAAQEAQRLQAEREAEEAIRLQAEQAAEQARVEESLRIQKERLAADRKLKAELWNELKIVAITKSLTTLYSVTLLSVLTHVQLNLLGRYAYLASLAGEQSAAAAPASIPLDPFEDAWARSNPQAAAAGPSKAQDDQTISSQTEERYLTFSWWFLHRGWKELNARVRSRVEEVVGKMPLKAELNHGEMMHLLRKIRRRVENEYITEEDDDEEDEEGLKLPSGSATPTASNASNLPAMPSSDRMLFGAEDLMPKGKPNGHLHLHEEDDAMSASMMSQSTATTAGGSKSRSRLGRRRKRRVNFLLQYLLPQTPQDDLSLLFRSGLVPTSSALPSSLKEWDPVLASLLDETRDLLESKDASRVWRRSLAEGIDGFEDSLRMDFGLNPFSLERDAGSKQNEDTSRFTEVTSPSEEQSIRLAQSTSHFGRSLRLASILPLLNTRSKEVIQREPSVVLDRIRETKELKAWSAVVFSSWTEGVQ